METMMQALCVMADETLSLSVRWKRREEAEALYPPENQLFHPRQFLPAGEFAQLISWLRPGQAYHIVDFLAMEWDVLAAGDFLLLAGPYTSQVLTGRETEAIFRAFHGSMDQLGKYRRHLFYSTLLHSHQAEKFLRGCCRVLTGQKISETKTLRLLSIDPFAGLRAEPDKYVSYRHDSEAAFTACIAHGLAGEAVDILKALQENQLPLLDVTNRWTAAFYHFSLYCAMAQKGARRAGVPAMAIEETANLYLKRALSAENEQEIRRLGLDMAEAMGNLVSSISLHQYSETVGNIVYYIQRHYSEAISTGGIARHFGLNSSYMSACFHRETGSTIMTFINDLRLQYAKCLLDLGGGEIREICEKAGIADQGYFTRIFKKKYGLTPTQYRDEILGKGMR